MEAPRFFRNKAISFSSAFLAVSLIACADNGKVEPPASPTLEQNYLNADVLVGPLKNQNLDESTLDHSCGILLDIGQSRKFRIPTNAPPLDVDFELELTKNLEGDLTIGGLVVKNPTFFGVLSPGVTNSIPLGYAIPFSDKGQLFFAPFINSRQYLIGDCAPST